MKRVLVAMSGGVDSSVAAYLLQEQGYDVVGVTMQVWDYSNCDIDSGKGTCCSSADVDDARSVADKLGIPFYVLNCEEPFRSTVIDPFIGHYLKGQTPLPCINCNTYLKFDHLVQKMRALECDFLATGHYAQILPSANGVSLCTSEDSWKDQTYFLFNLEASLLSRLLFPVGGMQKAEIRKIAEDAGFVVARKKDSTGICFVGDGGYADFIRNEVPHLTTERGLIRRHPSGEILGHHDGIYRFTYGQRKGLGLDHHETLYVLSIDASTQTVWVGEQDYLYHTSCKVERVNWLQTPEERLTVKIRYAHKGASAYIQRVPRSDALNIEFDEPQRAITPGQAAVFYRGNELMGGGWIV